MLYLYRRLSSLSQCENILNLIFILGNNSLVIGQLISEDDFFYVFEKRATYFYENTVPIWESINNGNWKITSDIIRKIARETYSNLDIYSGSIGNLAINGHQIYLGNSENPSNRINVPKFLFKLVYDRKNPERGTVFITVNDPGVQKFPNGSLSEEYTICENQSGCNELYPTFSDTKKGYTYCCTLSNFTYVQLNEVPLLDDTADFGISCTKLPFKLKTRP